MPFPLLMKLSPRLLIN